MSFKTRLFFILLTAGLAGVLSFLLVDLPALVALLPVPAGVEIPQITPAIKLLSLIQPAMLLALAVFSGVALAHKVGLSSPAAEAAARGNHVWPALKPQIVPGIIGGLSGGGAIVALTLLTKPFLSAETVERIAAFGRLVPLPTRLLYGGITEELLLRWGLMTLLVWAMWRLLQRREGEPKTAYLVAAIVISSLVFGVGHLPVAYMILPEATVTLTLYVIVANSIFGLIAGYLYWKRGLESAMLAHMLAHVVMLTASYFGAYY
ncbi:MAG TPA: CPBP family intramembrane glutamic endopeptidase [Pyrinomonadaceae bacterium]